MPTGVIDSVQDITSGNNLNGELLENKTTNTGANISYGILFVLAISGLNVYGIIIAG
jgi:NADH:ubiquinone oxidoreductase subunit H